MGLKAVKPEVVEPEKPKFMLSGKSGVGKTLFALAFPRPYLIDTEGGATREQYTKKLTAVGGAYFGKEQGSQDFATVNEEIRTLATTKHEYKTLIVDSFSYLYMLAASAAEEKGGSDFGRDKKEANRPTRQLMRWLEVIDMTAILICHQKEKWVRRGKEVASEGTTFDGYDKLEYILDLWLEVQKLGDNRFMVVKKSRIEGFPEAKELPLEFKAFSTLYGEQVIEREAQAIELVSASEAALIGKLIEALNIDKDTVETWLEKAKVDRIEELTAEQGKKILAHCNKKLASVGPPVEPKTDNGGKVTTATKLTRKAVAGRV